MLSNWNIKYCTACADKTYKCMNEWMNEWQIIRFDRYLIKWILLRICFIDAKILSKHDLSHYNAMQEMWSIVMLDFRSHTIVLLLHIITKLAWNIII